ncbi:unnamed protein product [Prorocentrum cordatum]|uniref:Apple domain-containing protein n=1 Tax=Prorocentrum cordatum TaxID=2364126 RepID=A0ABN9X3L7_9DINO|nr:unnamed protein product [Polarella glacialis]
MSWPPGASLCVGPAGGACAAAAAAGAPAERSCSFARWCTPEGLAVDACLRWHSGLPKSLPADREEPLCTLRLCVHASPPEHLDAQLRAHHLRPPLEAWTEPQLRRLVVAMMGEPAAAGDRHSADRVQLQREPGRLAIDVLFGPPGGESPRAEQRLSDMLGRLEGSVLEAFCAGLSRGVSRGQGEQVQGTCLCPRGPGPLTPGRCKPGLGEFELQGAEGRAEVVEHDIWDSFGPGFCRSRDRCACAPRSPKDCAVTARGGAGSWSHEGARCRVAGADVAREAGGCGELCARDPTCHFAYADWDGCLLYRACDLSRAPDRQGANLSWQTERCTCAELPSGSDCAASVAGQPGHAPGTCRLGDLHALEDCRESCVADLTCRFAYFERGGCHMYRSCISSRVPANAGTNMRRVPDLGAAQVERHDIFLTTGHGFCEPGRLCTCAESAEVCAESLRAHPHGVPPGTCLRAGVRALEDCQQMCAADPSCWFAYFEQGGCHLYESCEKSRVPMHDGVNLRRLPPAEAGEVRHGGVPRRVRVLRLLWVHLGLVRGGGVKMVPYVQTWLWPSVTLAGFSSLCFGVYIGKITNSHEWKEIFLDYCHHKRTQYSPNPLDKIARMCMNILKIAPK